MSTAINTVANTRELSFKACVDPEQPIVAASDRLDSHRFELERYIATIFHAAYGATVMEFLPLLCSLKRHGSYQAALGLRSASAGTLFCEQYLEHGVHWHINKRFGRSVRDNQVMELGNLVSSEPGQAVWLYLLVVRALQQAGVGYLLFAANRAVRASIRRCGFEYRTLCDADPACLGDRAAEWGSYYRGQPQVILADLNAAVSHGRQSTAIRKIWEEQAGAIEDVADAIRATRF